MAKPLLFITGFLGAGKTTLLHSLLEHLNELGHTADVILNDYENAEIDAATLPEYAASIFPIAASCACCDSLEDLVELCLAAQKSEGDVLLIELNGTADPLPLLETFTLLESKMPFFPRWQVGVVDARDWGRREQFAPLERRQIETATFWIPSHIDHLSKTETDQISCAVGQINPYRQITDSAALAAEIAAAINRSETSESREIAPGSISVNDHEHRLSHQFTGCQIPMPGRYRSEQIVKFLEALPGEVIRAKVLVKLQEFPGSRWLFERVGSHPVGNPRPVNEIKRAPASLVCIGPRLSPEKLEKLASEHFGI